MPVRATKRGAERTPLDGDFDVLICGASFAGLAVARELAGSRRARARWSTATRSASARRRRAPRRPSGWSNLGLGDAIQQTFRDLVIHTPRADVPLDAAVDVLDLRLPHALRAAARAVRRAVRDREGRRRGRAHVVHTDRGDLRAPLIVDALGWRRVLGAAASRPAAGGAAVARASRSTRPATGEDLELWLDPRYVPAGYSWSFPAATSCASASARSTRATTSRSRRAARRRPRRPAAGLPGQLDPAPDARRQSRTASSSPATAPATACRRPPRASAPRCTSGSPAGASCAPSSRAARRASRRSRATPRSPTSTASVPLAAARAAPRRARHRLAGAHDRAAADGQPALRRLVLRRTTSTSRRRSSRSTARRASRRRLAALAA